MCYTGAQKSEIQRIGKTQRRKSLHSFSSNDSIHVEPISEDPKSPDFMAFRVLETKKKKQRELSRFRTDNIVHMRSFMASLGGSGSGLFSPKGDGEVPTELGKWDIDNIPEEVDGGDGARNGSMNTASAAKVVFSSPADGMVRSYYDAILQLPLAFYFNRGTGITLQATIVPRDRLASV